MSSLFVCNPVFWIGIPNKDINQLYQNLNKKLGLPYIKDEYCEVAQKSIPLRLKPTMQCYDFLKSVTGVFKVLPMCYSAS